MKKIPLIAMLKMVVYPIVLFSLILGAASLPLKRSGHLGGAVLSAKSIAINTLFRT